MSLELEIVTKLKARLTELNNRSRSDVADGLCLQRGHDGIPFEYGYSMGYLRAIRDFGVITEEIAQDVLKGEG